MEYIPLCLWITHNKPLTIHRTHLLFFYLVQQHVSFSTITGLSIQNCRVRLKTHDNHIHPLGSHKFTKILQYSNV